jgi:sulfur carrier protein
MMMQIEVNGETTEVSEDATISVLLTQLSVTGQRLAVEVNEDIVPRSQHTAFQLSAGDRVEIVHAIGGG